MKRILALIGLIMIGAMLLADPNTGAIAVIESATTSTTAEATETTAPPDPGSEDDTTTSTSGESSTTTVEESTNTAEDETTSDAATQGADGTYIGNAVDSEFGDFQVEITVENGVMTSITTLQEPSDRKSANINNEAIPYYTEEALELQSSDFDVLSGATVTWQSWGASLESALEQAGLT